MSAQPQRSHRRMPSLEARAIVEEMVEAAEIMASGLAELSRDHDFIVWCWGEPFGEPPRPAGLTAAQLRDFAAGLRDRLKALNESFDTRRGEAAELAHARANREGVW